MKQGGAGEAEVGASTRGKKRGEEKKRRQRCAKRGARGRTRTRSKGTKGEDSRREVTLSFWTPLDQTGVSTTVILSCRGRCRAGAGQNGALAVAGGREGNRERERVGAISERVPCNIHQCKGVVRTGESREYPGCAHSRGLSDTDGLVVSLIPTDSWSKLEYSLLAVTSSLEV